VKISAVAEQNQVLISVSDTGLGIPEEFQSRVFERFYRIPGRGSHGAGLGLAIAKEIVEAHNGRLSLQSADGQGSTFSFTLPRADRETGASADESETASKVTQ